MSLSNASLDRTVIVFYRSPAEKAARSSAETNGASGTNCPSTNARAPRGRSAEVSLTARMRRATPSGRRRKTATRSPPPSTVTCVDATDVHRTARAASRGPRRSAPVRFPVAHHLWQSYIHVSSRNAYFAYFLISTPLDTASTGRSCCHSRLHATMSSGLSVCSL